jgi:hypothetical protein
MAQMQALLKIKADVEGEGKINALGRAIGGLSSTAGRVSGGLKGLAGAAGGLSGALGALVPIGVGAGLAGIATHAINAADNMNDLSQKTGVSVESLSKFQQAANASGTSIEGVGAAMIKLSKGMTTGKMPAIDALNQVGINAKDASGKLKGTDQIMLEVADKFAKMPDGAQKTALALQLFGKAGADMIPMLNGGSKAISDLKATMSTDAAQSADRFNDKLEILKTKAGELGLRIGTLLLPYLEKFVDLLISASNTFAAMPGPLQAVIGGAVALAAAFVVLAPAITAVISIAGLLAGIKIGATIAGWAALAGPAIIAIKAAFAGLLAFFTGTLLPGLLAFFSGPVGWTVLAVAAVVAMVVLFRKPLGEFAVWVGTWGKSVGQFFVANVITPLTKAWQSMVEFLPKALNVAATTIQNVFAGVGTAIKGVLNNILRGVFSAVNGAISNINRLIITANNLSARVRGPMLPTLPTLSIPAFAKGGVVSRPTIAVVGDGAEDEYIIPASKMQAASTRFLNGARGAAVIPSSSGGGGVAAPGSPQINITTGPVLQIDGQMYATLADLERTSKQTADQILALLRTPAGRRAVGVAG